MHATSRMTHDNVASVLRRRLHFTGVLSAETRQQWPVGMAEYSSHHECRSRYLFPSRRPDLAAIWKAGLPDAAGRETHEKQSKSPRVLNMRPIKETADLSGIIVPLRTHECVGPPPQGSRPFLVRQHVQRMEASPSVSVQRLIVIQCIRANS